MTYKKHFMKCLNYSLHNTHPMDALRTGISFISGYDEDIDNRSLAINKERAYRLLGTIPNIVANSYRILTKQRLVRSR